MKRFKLHPLDACEHAIDFATRTRPLTYDELWEWCRLAPYYTRQNGYGHLRLIHRSTDQVVAENAEAKRFPLMVARVTAVCL